MPVIGSWDEYFATRRWRVAAEIHGQVELRAGPGMSVGEDGDEASTRAVASFDKGRFELDPGYYFTSPMSSARGRKGVLLQEVSPDTGTDLPGSRTAVGIAVLRKARQAGAVK